jgi:hypothetical protein
VAGGLIGCGGGSGGASVTSSTSSPATPATARTVRGPPPPAPPTALRPSRRTALPAARAGGAGAAFGGRIVFVGGLSGADVSTDTVFALHRDGGVATLAPLPSAIHDAAAAVVGSRLLVFGGGVSEGSDHVLQVQPGPPRQVGTLPQALSDLVAVKIAGVAYVAGGWNGTATNRTIYAVSGAGAAQSVGRLPTGVRYPAAGALNGQVLIAGGETTSGAPTAAGWSFAPGTGAVTPLPPLPVPTDHAAGAPLGGRFYVLGGLRRGTLTRAIVSWAPGERQWRRSGLLPVALSDASAVPFMGGITLLGGRSAAGRVATITALVPR